MNLDLEKVSFTKISDIEIPDIFFNRLLTGNDELDSIFGSGILPGSTITLKALPGVGKSTFALTISEMLTNVGYNVAYSSGEEDINQLAYNCKRLGVNNLQIGTITDVDELLDIIPNMQFMVIDSFQTLTTKKDLNRNEKTKYCIENLVKKAKVHECALMFIVQETTSGEIRGGTQLPYAVDVNMKIEKDPEDGDIRIFDVYKNRFGQTLKHQARMNSSGYEFLGEYSEPTVEKQSKTSVKEVRKEKILAFDEPPLLTMERVMLELDVKEQTARILLSELEQENKILKYGRGKDAIWKITKA